MNTRTAAFAALSLGLSLASPALAQVPPAPATSAPNGSVRTARPTYTWTAVAGATSYGLLAHDSNQKIKVLEYHDASAVCSGSTCTRTQNTPLALGSYTWQARSLNASGASPWGAARGFTVVGPAAPTGLAPTGSVFTATPAWSWQPSTGATSYALQVLNPDGSQRFIDVSIPASVCASGTCSHTSGYTLPIGSYTWRVRGKHDTGAGPWSAAVGINVQGPPPPVTGTPNTGAPDPTPTYTWTASNSATRYTVQALTLENVSQYMLTYDASAVCVETACTLTPATVLPIGNYKWHIRAVNSAGAGAWSVDKPFAVTGTAAPVSLTPSGSVTVAQPTYTWQSVLGATGYQVEAFWSDGTQRFFEAGIPASACSEGICSVTPNQTLIIGPYTWRVAGYHEAGRGAWSPLGGFEIQGPPAPVAGTPNTGAPNPTPTYTWTASNGATSYTLEVLTLENVSEYTLSYGASAVCVEAACTATPANVLPIGDYKWRIRGVSGTGAGAWSAERGFAVTGPTPPTPLAPTGTIAVPSPTYSWQPSAGATGYSLMVVNSSGGFAVLDHYDASAVCAGNLCTATPAASLGVDDYTWYVRGMHAGGGGAWNSGTVIHVAASSWPGVGCGGVPSAGDFNGDGHTDRLCSMHGVTYVSLSTSTGLPAGTPWLVYQFAHPIPADFNNDGKTDVAEWDMMSAQFRVALALPSGDGFAEPVLWGVAQVALGDGTTAICRIGTAVVGTGDFDGDGLTDVYCRRSDLDTRYFMVGKNTGSSFAFSIFGSPTCDTVQERIGAQDMDGDGLTDFTCVTQHGQLAVQVSDGSSFVPNSFTGISASYCDRDSYQFTDLNADGAPDVVCPLNGNVALSTGRSFIDQGSFGGFCSYARDMFAADIDSDGIAEIICNREDVDEEGNPVPQARDIMMRRWTGTQLLGPELLASYWCNDNSVGGGDFNGDGRTDLLCGSTRVGIVGTTGVVPDLMIATRNTLGGTTSVEYTPSSAFPNTNDPSVQLVVTAVTLNDGRGGISRSTYEYAGAARHPKEGSLGFETIKKTLPCLEGESTCPYILTQYSQDLPSRNQATLVQRGDGLGGVLQETRYFYTTQPGPNPPRSVLAGEVRRTDYGPSGDSKTTSTTYAYDDYGNTTEKVAHGEVTFGGVEILGDELATSYTYEPDPESFLTSRLRRQDQHGETGDLLASEEHGHNASGDVTRVRQLVEPGRYVERATEYDSHGNPLSLTNARKGVTTLTYDADNLHVTTVGNPAVEVTSYTWQPLCGQLATSTDQSLQTTTFTYDALCREQRKDSPDGSFVIHSQVNLGDPQEQHSRVETPGTNGSQYVMEYFDGFGRVYRTRKRGPSPGQDIVSDLAYDERGNVTATSEPYYEGEIGNEVRYEYDRYDRLTRKIHADGTETTTAYDLWQEETTNAKGQPVTTSWGSTRSRTTTTRASGEDVATTYTRDALGRQSRIRDNTGNEWSWTYDGLGRPTVRDDPDSGVWTFEYDDANGRTTQTDAKGQVTETALDQAGRTISRSSGAGVVAYVYSEDRTGGYQNVGRLTTVTSPGSVLRLDYDGMGRICRQTREIDGVEYVVTTEYDLAGRVSTLTYPDSDRIVATYDGAGRVSGVAAGPVGYTVAVVESVTYDAVGRPLVQINGNGTVTTRTYWPQTGRPYTVATTSPVEPLPIQQLTYASYDEIGLLQKVTSPYAGENWDYGYDDGNRLVSARWSAGEETFEYDAIGRLTHSGRAGDYSYPGAGEPRPHAPTSVGGELYTYDANGNVTSGGGHSAVWDSENRLVAASGTQFMYDASGNRLKKTSASGSSLYPFGDDFEITNGVVTKYITVPGLGVVAKRVVAGGGLGTYWLHTDRQGSIQAITSDDSAEQQPGALVFRRAYRPYGETLSEEGDHLESRGWIDQRNDPDAQLTYLHARYYDPFHGLFLSADPAGAGEAGVGLNRYGYAGGNPVNATDRSGQRFVLDREVCWQSTFAGRVTSDVCKVYGHWEPDHVIDHVGVPGQDWPDRRYPGRGRGGRGGGGRGGGGGGQENGPEDDKGNGTDGDKGKDGDKGAGTDGNKGQGKQSDSPMVDISSEEFRLAVCTELASLNRQRYGSTRGVPKFRGGAFGGRLPSWPSLGRRFVSAVGAAATVAGPFVGFGGRVVSAISALAWGATEVWQPPEDNLDIASEESDGWPVSVPECQGLDH